MKARFIKLQEVAKVAPDLSFDQLFKIAALLGVTLTIRLVKKRNRKSK